MKKISLEEKKQRATIVLNELKQLFPKAETILRYSNPLELVIAVVLSAQTTDVQVNKVTEKLFQKYKTLDDYVRADIANLEKALCHVGLYKSKAKNISGMVRMLQEKFSGHIPATIQELMELPGVGRKTANVVLGVVHGKAEGIAVDTHVTRLAKKFGLTDFTDVKKIEKDLMEIVPQKEWSNFTMRIIDYGRKYSPAHKVNDETDPISLKLSHLKKEPVLLDKKQKNR